LLATKSADKGVKEQLETSTDVDGTRTLKTKWYGTLKGQATALSRPNADKTSKISEKTEIQVLAYNL
jgi:hypothetical protein